VTIGASVRRALATMVLLGPGLLGACGSTGSSSSATNSLAPSSSADAGPDSSSDDLVAPSGFRAVIVTITRPDGSTEQHCMWIADDEASQQQGLMGVTDPELGGRAGMVFEFPDEMTTGFWMKDTPLALSIAWFDASGSFVSSADMPPCPTGTRTCPSYSAEGPYRTAIEVPLGGLEPLGLVEGSRIVIGDKCDQSPRGASPAT
jgi:uncharacterized membrane protein (UPF0127 family)